MEEELIYTISTVLFLAGIVTVLTRTNAILLLIGVEMILAASNINFVAFSNYYGVGEGKIFALFVIIIAACEAAVALAIIVKMYKYYKTLDLNEVNHLKG
ncbi:MAG: NADH-quinone oxidoreductase subunit NuoK [Cyclobacteriaceae bacterium]|nr:NADH-quinone oxidoreductase subunit NuoK [Cyclobacteriaceae bacterium]